MARGRLFIGTRRYSSWSVRVIPLAGGDTPAVKATSPSGLVPYLEHDGHRIWETLAICEYCAEITPALWPAALAARVHARVVATEMHGGFRELRIAMPMNLGRDDFAGRGRTPGALADIARIEGLWAETRDRFGADGPFLFGAAFNAADAMYAPVVARFLTYQPDMTPATNAYCHAVRNHPLVAAWYKGAATEPAAWLVEKYENP
jgi:glutathione S-transferase